MRASVIPWLGLVCGVSLALFLGLETEPGPDDRHCGTLRLDGNDETGAVLVDLRSLSITSVGSENDTAMDFAC